MIKTKSILTILLSGYLILAMGGLSVFHHLCGCNSEIKENSSVFIEHSCCSSSNEDSMTCHSDSDNKSCGEDGCNDCNCETQVEVFALDYTIVSEQSSLVFSKLYQFAKAKNVVQEIILDSQIEELTPFSQEDKSPPKAGKYLVILHQNIKIPFSVS
jgi:hypothetical protein